LEEKRSAIMSGMTAKEALRWVKRGFVIEWTGEEFVVVNFLLNPTRVKQRWTKNVPISSKPAGHPLPPPFVSPSPVWQTQSNA
jgi:hypothetical protein